MDEKTLDKMLSKDSEDFKEVLEEFKSSIETLQTKLKPVIDKIKQTKDKNFSSALANGVYRIDKHKNQIVNIFFIYRSNLFFSVF